MVVMYYGTKKPELTASIAEMIVVGQFCPPSPRTYARRLDFDFVPGTPKNDGQADSGLANSPVAAMAGGCACIPQMFCWLRRLF